MRRILMALIVVTMGAACHTITEELPTRPGPINVGGGQPLAPQPIAQGNGHRALRLGLSNDVLIELSDDLARGQRAHGRRRAFRKRDGHSSSIVRFGLV